MHQAIKTITPDLTQAILIVIDTDGMASDAPTLPKPIIDRLPSPNHLILIPHEVCAEDISEKLCTQPLEDIEFAVLLTKSMCPLVYKIIYTAFSRGLETYVVIAEERTLTNRDRMNLAVSGSLTLTLEEFFQCSGLPA